MTSKASKTTAATKVAKPATAKIAETKGAERAVTRAAKGAKPAAAKPAAKGAKPAAKRTAAKDAKPAAAKRTAAKGAKPEAVKRTAATREVARPVKVAAKKSTARAARTAGSAETASKRSPAARARDPGLADVDAVLAALKRLATRHTLEGMTRYGLPSEHAWGVAVGDIRGLAKQVGRDHGLAAALWASGVYEARLLAAFVDDPAQVTATQMDRWCRDFDNWGVCDTACFALFDRTPHAFGRVEAWAVSEAEFVKRGAFALLASLALHDKGRDDAVFVSRLPLIERAASDPRNFVKKGVSWALRGIGGRNAALRAAATAVARRLAESPESAARWVGKDALREFTRRVPRAEK